MGDRVGFNSRCRNPFQYVTNQPPEANLAFHPSGVGKWVPASAGKAKAGMDHSDSGWTRGVQVKLWDPLRTRAIPERLRGAFTTRRYTNPRLPLLLPYGQTDGQSAFSSLDNVACNACSAVKWIFYETATALGWQHYSEEQRGDCSVHIARSSVRKLIPFAG